MAVIGLDVGTAGCKATVGQEDGVTLAYAYQGYSLSIPGPGMAELDARIVWQGIKRVLRQVAQGQGITAIAVASLGESFVCLGPDDEVLTSSMLYSDVRGAKEAEEIQRAAGAGKLFEITGMPVSPMYTLCKLQWLRRHTDSCNRARRIMLFGDYVGYMLTGQRVIDYSLASRTLMFDVHEKRWSEEIAALFDIDIRMLSEPAISGAAVGELRPEIADELGLSRGTILYVGAHDQACAALGVGVLHPGDCVDGMGTSECITTIVPEDSDARMMMTNNFCMEPYAVADRYITLAFNPAAGAAVNWYRATIDRERNAACEATGENIFAAMEAECQPEPTSLLFLPYLAGTGTPHMDPYASGALLGLKLGTTRGEMYKALLEGICFEIMLNAALLSELGTDIRSLTCVGGLTRSDLLMQIKADIMGVPVSRLVVKESGTLGLAMLCLVAGGAYRDYEQAAHAMVQVERTFEPDNKRHTIYEEKLHAYRQMYGGIKRIMGGGLCH
jgi:xylulokinase